MPSRKNSGRCFSESLSPLYGLLRSHQGQYLAAQRSTSTDFLTCSTDNNVWDCFSRLTGFSHAAQWASWRIVAGASETPRSRKDDGRWGAASCFTAVRGCVQSLVDVGFEPPEWESLQTSVERGGGPNTAQDWLK